MNPRQRKELLATLDELGLRHPDWRFGQLLANVAGWADVDQWDAEDEQLLAAARAHLTSIAGASDPGVTHVAR